MGFVQLFVAASVPVLNVLIVTGIGSFISTNYIGILPEEARKHLNNVVFYVFNPALVSTNLAQTITLDSMLLLWFMPVNVLFTFMIGSMLGWIVIQITNAPARLRGLVLGCCSAGNLGNLLFIIIPAICKEKASPFGAPDVCHSYGLAYSSLSMALGAIFLWSYVYNIIRITATTEDTANGTNQYSTGSFPEENTKLISESSRDYMRVDSSNGDELPISVYDESKLKVSSCRLRQKLSSFLSSINIKRLFAPSTIGVIVGFVIGLIPQIRNTLIGEGAPLRVIQDSASLLSDGAIPATTLIMGGNLIKGLRGSNLRLSLIFGVIAVRYIFLPLFGIVIVKGAVHIGLVHADPLYQFILLLQYCLPPAMNISTITQLFGAGESECSVLLLWTYALASVSLTLWSTLFMWLVS